MLDVQGSHRRIWIYRTKRELLDLGAASLRDSEVQEDLFLAHTPTTRYSNPFYQLLCFTRRANWILHWNVFEFDRQAGRRSLIGLSFPSRRELLQFPGQIDRRQKLQKWRLAAQRLAASAAGLWREEDVLFSNQRQIDWEKIAGILHTDQEASDFADMLSQMGTFYWCPPESTIWHDVPSKGFDADGTFRVLGTARVLKDRRTKRTKPLLERNRAQHLRHLRYRGRTLEILHKLKKQNSMFKTMDRPSYFRDHRGLITSWKKTR